MSQDGPELEALHRALLSAFPNGGALERMLMFGMGLNLAEIGSGNLSDQVFDVIRFVKARGLLDQLIQSALTANPGHPGLRAVADHRAQHPEKQETAAPNPSATLVKVDKLALRKAMQASFTAEELEVLCADLQQNLNARGHDVHVSLDEVGGATKTAKLLNLIEFLDRRRLLDFLVQAVREQRPGSV